jgi:radical SAM protein with 4Fe4S-binding SPASM domain
VPQLNEFARRNGFDLLTIRNVFFVESSSDGELRERLTPDANVWRECGYGHGGNLQQGSFVCQEPFWFPTVFADGTLVLCEQDYNAQLALGQISEDVSFADLWYCQRATQLRKIIRDDMESVSFCRKCPYMDRPITDFNVEAHYVMPDPDARSATSGRS